MILLKKRHIEWVDLVKINYVLLGDKMIIFETERLILRKWTVNDADDFYEIDSNPNVTTPIGWGTHKNKNKSLKFVNILIKKDTEWAIVNKENNKAIGCIGYNYDSMRKCSVSSRNTIFALNESYWGSRFCSEAVKRIMKYLFEDEDIKILVAQHFSYNIRSKKVIERCGFKHEGTIRMFEIKSNKIIDKLIYSLSKSEYSEIYT